MSESLDEAPRASGSLALGIFIALLLQLLQIPVFLAVGYLSCLLASPPGYLCGLAAVLSLGVWGVSQLLYVVPALLVARVKAGSETVKGMIIGAALVFLLNAGCWGVVGLTAVRR